MIGSGLSITNNEIKDILKVIKSLENRKFLMKETSKNVLNRKGGFLGLLMIVGLLLMKILLALLGKWVLIPLGLMTFNRFSYSKKSMNYGWDDPRLITGRYHLKDLFELAKKQYRAGQESIYSGNNLTIERIGHT